MIRVPSTRPGLGFSVSPSFWDSLPDLITAGATGTTAILQQVQKPYVIPGTNVIYNPANQGTATQAGVTAQNFGQGAAWGMTPLVLIAGIGLVVFLMMGKK